jgi:hypothetical protein
MISVLAVVKVAKRDVTAVRSLAKRDGTAVRSSSFTGGGGPQVPFQALFQARTGT